MPPKSVIGAVIIRLLQRREMYLRFIWMGSAYIFGCCCILAEESGISTIKRLFSTYLDKMVQGGVKYHK